jgi:hypothetical protein
MLLTYDVVTYDVVTYDVVTYDVVTVKYKDINDSMNIFSIIL